MSENAKKAPAMNLYDQSESAKKARFLLRTQARCQTFSEWRSPHPAPIFVESLETLQALPQIELYKPVQPDPQCSEIHYSVTPSDSPPDVDETGYKPTGSAAAGKSSIPTEESLGENPQIPLELVLRAINFVERVVRDTCKLQGCPKVGGPLRHWHDPFVDAYLESKFYLQYHSGTHYECRNVHIILSAAVRLGRGEFDELKGRINEGEVPMWAQRMITTVEEVRGTRDSEWDFI